MCRLKLWLELCFLLIISIIPLTNAASLVRYIDPGETFVSTSPPSSQNPDIYCYKGRSKHIIRLWESVQLQINLTNDQFEQFDGVTPQEVAHKIEDHVSSWNFNFYTFKKRNVKLNPFDQTCIGILTSENYSVELKLIRIDYWKVLFLICGLVIFLCAPKLCDNSLFYYLTGISFGVCASFLILVYILSRFLPKKPVMYSFIVGGWTVGVYLAQLLWDNLRVIMVEHKSYVVSYCAITGVLSFVVCYRFGPVSDQRTRNLVKWAIQGLSLVLIFCSSEFQEASLAIILVILIGYNIPVRAISYILLKLRKFWYKPTPKLLTEDEYHQQGVLETKKALEELRGYCSSPECNQWKTVLKLKEPLRFAQFMEGASHLEDEEMLAFETDMKSIESELLTDDSSSE